jgi:hypothetical protein
MIRAKGRGKDTILAHITPREAALLKKRGGAGTINPDTGLLEFQTEDDYDYSQFDQASSDYQVEGGGQPFYGNDTYNPYIPNDISSMDNRDVGQIETTYASPVSFEDFYAPQIGPDGQDYSQFGKGLYYLDKNGVPTEASPEQVAATNPQYYPGGVLPKEGQETVFTPDGSPYYQNLTPISTPSAAPKTKEQQQKEKDYSNLLSQLLRLGLGAGTAYALSRGVQQPAAKKAEEQAQTAKNERNAIAAPYQGIGKGLIAGAQAGNLSASNLQAVKAARAMAAQNISRTGGVGVLQGANSIADLEARLLDNQLIQGIKIANIGDNYAINAIQAGMVADNALATSQADFAKQLGTLLAPMVLGYSPNLPSGLPGGGQNPGLINTIADAGGNLLNSGGNAISSLSTQRGEV